MTLQLFEQATGGDPKGFALLAVGGYGRAELAPHMPFLAKLLTPLPALEASRPAAA